MWVAADLIEEKQKMSEQLQKIVDEVKSRFNAGLYEFRDEQSLIVAPEQIVSVCQALRDEFDFELLCEQTAVDYWPELSPRFHVVYRLRSLKHNLIIGLRVPLNGNSPLLPSVVGVYANANWMERELYDMFGIGLTGHPDVRRILMPNDWEGHPLRKDYPLGYEEVQYSFNYDEINLRKPYAKK